MRQLFLQRSLYLHGIHSVWWLMSFFHYSKLIAQPTHLFLPNPTKLGRSWLKPFAPWGKASVTPMSVWNRHTHTLLLCVWWEALQALLLTRCLRVVRLDKGWGVFRFNRRLHLKFECLCLHARCWLLLTVALSFSSTKNIYISNKLIHCQNPKLKCPMLTILMVWKPKLVLLYCNHKLLLILMN